MTSGSEEAQAIQGKLEVKSDPVVTAAAASFTDDGPTEIADTSGLPPEGSSMLHFAPTDHSSLIALQQLEVRLAVPTLVIQPCKPAATGQQLCFTAPVTLRLTSCLPAPYVAFGT